MASKTEICNLALSHLGISKPIANVDTEQSQEASACRVFFNTTRQLVLRDFQWPFATKIIALELVEEDPNDEWKYSYRYPTNCINFRRVLSGIRNDERSTRETYRIVNDSSGQLIYTDQNEAEAEYTLDVTNTEILPPDFVMALSYRLAAYIAPRLTAGDPFKLGDKSAQLYQIEISRAAASAYNEEQPEQLPDSEFISARN